jgi:hypothetical protein
MVLITTAEGEGRVEDGRFRRIALTCSFENADIGRLLIRLRSRAARKSHARMRDSDWLALSCPLHFVHQSLTSFWGSNSSLSGPPFRNVAAICLVSLSLSSMHQVCDENDP